MSRILALAALLAAPSAAQVRREKAETPTLPPSAIPPSSAERGQAVPPAPTEVPALKGVPKGPTLKGPLEPEPAVEPELLAAPVPVDAKLFARVVDHVRKYCSTDEESGLCCLMGQAPLKKKAPDRALSRGSGASESLGAPTRTACLEIEVPEQEGPVRDLAYREVFTGLTIVTARAEGKPPIVEYTTLEMAMGGSVAQVEVETEERDGTQRRADPLKPGEAERLFESAAKDLLTITPVVKI